MHNILLGRQGILRVLAQTDQNDKDLDRMSERQDLEGKELKQETTLHDLELVSLVHSHVNAAEQYDFE
ncbi:hypothetical protein RchiOBHm_Chr2g0171851 [Rosa chinensis]|uniref:Uncharacterized protein n=1 Tax=Rosa chinensis TaxID=74649 RepID=A0A2P6S5G0_ROSCH|nr:hypothetical protein RchiOBHm_Chr2g0171851 [Rosa chinensis]